MPSTRKQQKANATRSREADMLSDLENLDVMLGSLHRGEIDIENTNLNGNSEVGECSQIKMISGPTKGMLAVSILLLLKQLMIDP